MVGRRCVSGWLPPERMELRPDRLGSVPGGNRNPWLHEPSENLDFRRRRPRWCRGSKWRGCETLGFPLRGPLPSRKGGHGMPVRSTCSPASPSEGNLPEGPEARRSPSGSQEALEAFPFPSRGRRRPDRGPDGCGSSFSKEGPGGALLSSLRGRPSRPRPGPGGTPDRLPHRPSRGLFHGARRAGRDLFQGGGEGARPGTPGG